MLKIEKLKAGYNGMEILHGLDFAVQNKEIIAIIGPNGAGKSTLLKSIFNLADIYSGQIIFENKNITRLPTYQLIHQGISFVPQGRQIFGNLTVMENLEMGAFIFKQADELIAHNLTDVFNKFPFLQDKKEQLASSLSGGQQQMLALARALIQNPKLLLLDEPSLGLSPKTSKDIFQKIVEINKAGVTIIIVEQNAKQAIAIANRVYILEDGQVALEGSRNILQDNDKIKNIYFGGR